MKFHCIVCIKAVTLHASGKGAGRNSGTAVLNPFDRIALEKALAIAETRAGVLTVLTMGPPSCAFALYEAMAMGAAGGVLLSDTRFADADTLATSTALAAAITRLAPYDLVIFGARAADSDTGHVGPQTAEALGIPIVTGALACEWKDDSCRVERKIDEFRELYALSFPAALTVHPTACIPRDIPLAHIEEAYTQKEIITWSLEDLDLQEDRVGKNGSPTEVFSLKQAARERHCEFIGGPVETQAAALVDAIRKSGLIG